MILSNVSVSEGDEADQFPAVFVASELPSSAGCSSYDLHDIVAQWVFWTTDSYVDTLSFGVMCFAYVSFCHDEHYEPCLEKESPE